jgi:predicted dehydrogenase
MEKAEQHAEACGAAAYDDLRLILVEQQPDAAVFALPPAVAGPYHSVAAARGIPVLSETPLARSFDDAVRAVSVFYQAEVPLVVAARWRFDSMVCDMLGAARNGGVRLAFAVVTADLPSDPAWRGDAGQAGGGVLLHEAYEAVDLLVSLWGMPGDVTTQVSRLGPLSGTRYDTEDTAAVLGRYDGGTSFCVMAAHRPGPASLRLSLVGPDGDWTLTPQRVEHEGADRRRNARQRPTPAALRAAILERFATLVRERPTSYPGRAADQLATLAVLDAAYHSARTHAPESPERLYELAGMPVPRAALAARP